MGKRSGTSTPTTSILSRILGVALVPVWIGAIAVGAMVLRDEVTRALDAQGHVIPFGAGVIGWLVVRPLWRRFGPISSNLAETIEHEATHALFCYLTFGRVEGIEAHGDGSGRVRLNRTNALVTLSPYAFPLYAALALAVSAVVRDDYAPYAAALVGVGFGFHLASTAHELRGDQPDIAVHGRVFSYGAILACNLLVTALLLAWARASWSGVADLPPALLDAGQVLAAHVRRIANI